MWLPGIGAEAVNEMITKTMNWDAAEHLDGPAAIAAYLATATVEGHPAVIAVAMDDVARARDTLRAAGKAAAAPRWENR